MNVNHRIRPSVWLVGVAVCLAGIVAVAPRLVAPPDDASSTSGAAAKTPAAGRQADERSSTAPLSRSRTSPAPVEPPGAPGPDDKSERLQWLQSLQAWGMKNPLIASRWAIESLSPEECWSFLGLTGGIAFQLGAKNMQEGLALFENLKKRDGQKFDAGWEDGETMYTALMAKFAAGAVASDPAKAIEWAREYGSLYELAGHWAELDAQQATQWARSLTDAKELDAAVKAITSSLVKRGNLDDLVNWANSLVATPVAYDQAVTTMLQQLSQDKLDPMLQALLVEPPSDASMALSWIRGVSQNIYAKGALRGELLQQLAIGLGEQWLSNAEVQSELKNAITGAALTMWRSPNNDIRAEGFRDAVDYLATGGGGVIPKVPVQTWSPTWLEWCSVKPTEAIGWLTENRPVKAQAAVVEELRQRVTAEYVQAGYSEVGSYRIVRDNQSIFRLETSNPAGVNQEFTYVNGQWAPPLPQQWKELDLKSPVEKQMKLLSALKTLSPP